MDWKSGDWVIFDLAIGQVKELRSDGIAIFSDGHCETSGYRLAERFRPLTLKNKNIVETFDSYYMRLREIDGEAGFNYPDIHRYFSQLSLDAIDAEKADEFCRRAQDFVREARDYKAVIDGVPLFRRNLRMART